MKNVPYLLALHATSGLGPIKLKALIDYFKDPKLAWEAQSKAIRKNIDPESYADSIKKDGISWMTIYDKNYPALLKEIYNPPVILYYRGEIKKEDQQAIAIVGTRKITDYGKTVTRQFSSDLVKVKLTIVSGLASGVDTQAHLAALDAQGRTIAVLGGGLNKIYPHENKGLAERIIKQGAVISEFLPNDDPKPGNFPARNRIISGLSLAVLVTEAAEKSGSLITAKLALEQGRDVFAVPGPITSELSKGPIDLIRFGAIPVTNTQEILEELTSLL